VSSERRVVEAIDWATPATPGLEFPVGMPMSMSGESIDLSRQGRERKTRDWVQRSFGQFSTFEESK
jgi:hypothetical protein